MSGKSITRDRARSSKSRLSVTKFNPRSSRQPRLFQPFMSRSALAPTTSLSLLGGPGSRIKCLLIDLGRDVRLYVIFSGISYLCMSYIFVPRQSAGFGWVGVGTHPFLILEHIEPTHGCRRWDFDGPKLATENERVRRRVGGWFCELGVWVCFWV